MTTSDPKTLVSTGWLATHLNDPDLRVIDASWYLPSMNRDGRAEFAVAHIPGAVFFDIDELSDPNSTLPHMAPAAETIAQQFGDLGIGDASQVVVYDGIGIFSAARVWWLLRLIGKTEVAVLDGGLPKWRSEGRPLSDAKTETEPGKVTEDWQGQSVKNITQVAAASERGDHHIVDARSGGRFRGEDPEPRAGLNSGHIPGSRNVFFNDLLNEDATMKSADEMRGIFAAAGVVLDRPQITTCGSGVTAAVLSLALERIGHENHSLYDGSWTEWALESNRPIATGGA